MTNPATSPDAPETFTAHRCGECDQVWETSDLERCYECGTCGTRSTERRCEECNKFMGRADEDGCPDDGGECEEFDAIRDHDGAIIAAEDYDPAEPLSARQAALDAIAATERATKAEAAQNALFAGAEMVTFDQIVAGDRIIVTPTHRDVDPDYDQYDVLHARHVGDTVGLITEKYQHGHTSAHPATDTVYRTAQDGPTGGMSVTVLNEDLGTVSSPARGAWTSTGYGTVNEGGLLPHLTFGLSGGNMIWTLGCWWDPTIASAALDQFEQAARDLATAQNVTYDPAAGTPAVEHLPTASHGFILTTEPVLGMMITIGSTFMEDQPVAAITAKAGLHATASSPNMLGAAVTAARGLLDTLTMVPRHKD